MDTKRTIELLEQHLGVHQNNWAFLTNNEDLVNGLTHVLMRQRLPDLAKRASELVKLFEVGDAPDSPWGRAVCEVLQLVAFMPVGPRKPIEIAGAPTTADAHSWLLRWMLQHSLIVRQGDVFALVHPNDSRESYGSGNSLEAAVVDAVRKNVPVVEEPAPPVLTQQVQGQTLTHRIAALINQGSHENESNTPDFILAEFMAQSLAAFNDAVNRRNEWKRQALPTPELILDHVSDFSYKFTVLEDGTPFPNYRKSPLFADFVQRVYVAGFRMASPTTGS